MGIQLKKKIYPMYYLFPVLAIFLVFYSGSILGSFYFAFTNWSAMHPQDYKLTGLNNIILLLQNDKFRIAVKNVFIFNLVTTFFKTGFGLILALILNMKFRGRNLFRAIFYMPCILSPLIIGYIFKFLLHPDGFVNSILRLLSLDNLVNSWFGNPDMALWSVCIVEIWTWAGFCGVIFLAGLQSVPSDVIEAAKIDGANAWQIFWSVKMNFIKPSFTVVLILNIIGGFKVFDLVMATTNGGPGFITEVLSTLVYKQQAQGLFGYASAIGLIQFLLIAVVTVPIIIILKKWEANSQ